MLNPRRIEILRELGHGRVVTAPSLSGRFGVTTKTIRRDIASLVGLGAPVRTHLGRNGGWELADAPPPEPGSIRIVTPVGQFHRLTGVEGVRALVRSVVDRDTVRVDVVAADSTIAARAVALLPTPVRVEWPDDGSTLLAEVGRTLIGWYGADESPSGVGSHERVDGPSGPRPDVAEEGPAHVAEVPATGRPRHPPPVRTRIAELPSPERFDRPPVRTA